MKRRLDQQGKTVFVAASILLTLLGGGCVSISPVEPPGTTATSTVEPRETWQTVSQGIEQASFRISPSSTAEVMLFRLDPNAFDLRFEQATETKTIAKWMEDTPKAALILNGTYFNEDGTASGALISKKIKLSPRRFDADKSGVLQLSPEVRLVNTKQETWTPDTAVEAAQSFPFLILDGKAVVQTDTGKTARRSFVGLDASGKFYLGALPYGEMSLFEFARALERLPIPWVRVLNLDGGPSTGFAARRSGDVLIRNSFGGVANVIIVEPKSIR